MGGGGPPPWGHPLSSRGVVATKGVFLRCDVGDDARDLAGSLGGCGNLTYLVKAEDGNHCHLENKRQGSRIDYATL